MSKKYICKVCGKEFDNPQQLSGHKRCHVIRHTCEICGEGFSTGGAYHKHMKEKHPTNEKFICKCGKEFTTKAALILHKKSCPVCNEGKHFTCACGREFDTLRGFEMHRTFCEDYCKQENKESSSTKVCPECHKHLKNKSGLSKHMLEEHNIDIREFECVCGEKFLTKQALMAHEKCCDKIAPKGEFTCVCGKTYATEHGLLTHQAYCKQYCEENGIEFKERVCVCPECGKTFKNEAALGSHMRTHNGFGIEVCPICGEKFNGKSGLSSHYISKHTNKLYEGTFVCECGKVCKTKPSLTQHQLCCKVYCKNHGLEARPGPAKGCKHSEVSRLRRSKKMTERVTSGNYTPKTSGYLCGHFTDFNGDIYYLRSSYELIFAINLVLSDIEFSYESTHIVYKNAEGNERRYVPDFIIGNKIYEIKGNTNAEDVKLKADAAIEAGYDYEMLSQSDIKDISDELFETYDIDTNKIIRDLSEEVHNSGSYTFDMRTDLSS